MEMYTFNEIYYNIKKLHFFRRDIQCLYCTAILFCMNILNLQFFYAYTYSLQMLLYIQYKCI